jgi:hypothetical protein
MSRLRFKYEPEIPSRSCDFEVRWGCNTRGESYVWQVWIAEKIFSGDSADGEIAYWRLEEMICEGKPMLKYQNNKFGNWVEMNTSDMDKQLVKEYYSRVIDRELLSVGET